MNEVVEQRILEQLERLANAATREAEATEQLLLMRRDELAAQRRSEERYRALQLIQVEDQLRMLRAAR